MIERGWRKYMATLVPSTVPDEDRLRIRLGYYAGAAHALGALADDTESAWPRIIADLSLEVCDATDRLLLAALLGRPLP